MRPNQPSSRSTKTLGWFMADDLFDKKSMKNPEKDVEVAKSPPLEERKKKRNKKPQLHKRIEQVRTPSESSGTCEEVIMSPEDKQRVLGNVPAGFPPKDVPLAFYVPNDNKTEDFWYYDVASDGYYYEQNGAKGWRRRMPNSVMQKIKEQENLLLASGNNNKPSGLPTAALNAQAAAAAQALLLQQALIAQQQQPPLKYYDPTSDGFFYEMASVDGWKRRQPNKPLAASAPVGISRPPNNFLRYQANQATVAAALAAHHQAQQSFQNAQDPLHQHQSHGRSTIQSTPHRISPHQHQTSNQQTIHHPSAHGYSSIGAALARGQLPRNTIIDESSASSSVSEDTTSHDLYYDQLPRVSRANGTTTTASSAHVAMSSATSNQQIPPQLTDTASFPPITRPNQLNIGNETQRVPNFNAERFIQDLSFSGLDPTKVLGMASRTPVSSWSSIAGRTHHSTTVANGASSIPPTPTSASFSRMTSQTAASFDGTQPPASIWDNLAQYQNRDDEPMAKLMQELEKIWA